MVRITNGTTNKEVTRGAYENFYKPLGYHVVDNSNKKREVEIKKELKDEKKNNIDKGEKKSQKIEEFKKR